MGLDAPLQRGVLLVRRQPPAGPAEVQFRVQRCSPGVYSLTVVCKVYHLDFSSQACRLSVAVEGLKSIGFRADGL